MVELRSQSRAAQSDVRLPVDLLHLICSELASRLDFDTLFNCAVSSKHFADAGALANLYRISGNAPIKGGGNEALPLPEQELVVQKWSIMWRTIILSCLGQTMYPYVRFLRVLDLRDLYDLLDEDKFRGKIYKNFFSGQVAQFNVAVTPSTSGGRPGAKFLSNKSATLRACTVAIADVIVANAPMLEELTEPILAEYNIFSQGLPRWIPSMERLRSLELWDGRTLEDESLRNSIYAYCPNLERMRIYQWRGEDQDHQLAEFISGLPPNRLTYFETQRDCGIGPETCLAFNTHGASLKTLALALPDKGIPGLGLLQSCTKLEHLRLADLRPPHDLEATQNDVFLDMISWLKDCTSLLEISLTDFISAPAILAPVLSSGRLQLEELQISGRDDVTYLVKDHAAFHRAIGTQKELRTLLLKADPEPFNPDDRQLFCSQLCELKELRYLKLMRTSDYFQDDNMRNLADQLPNLEDLLVAGWNLGDATLERLSRLRFLKSLTVNGLSKFTTNGLLDFIENLGPGNHGLAISIDMADVTDALSNEEQDLIRESLATKVQGSFEYQLVRDPDAQGFYDSDSDSD